MARHSVPGSTRRTLRNAGLTVSLAGAALAAAASGAQAGEISVPHALAGALGPVQNLQVDPLANTGVDPLDNGIATKVSDFPAVGTTTVTDTVTKGAKVGELPGVALLAPLLPG
ncbi:hypothetical protein LG634_27995 [Streptomyces bambusae]|uniref:hypothetical protein n=1 Tax=Streptomyces bambusae TaxID=1550616 RepID=UPI001CFDD06E|nr:hypothetical protein [Streptomyces bambusae]MCB5168650.1 hypothetical protein [Streptomyces bambusae]